MSRTINHQILICLTALFICCARSNGYSQVPQTQTLPHLAGSWLLFKTEVDSGNVEVDARLQQLLPKCTTRLKIQQLDTELRVDTTITCPGTDKFVNSVVRDSDAVYSTDASFMSDNSYGKEKASRRSQWKNNIFLVEYWEPPKDKNKTLKRQLATREFKLSNDGKTLVVLATDFPGRDVLSGTRPMKTRYFYRLEN